ncbi:MAG: gliding motility-associated C-terminal domain-containing protein [Saprospirales bacterium]|nr:gliding motility-associated C-terminal domain-containing protein [Saprospirales bacterium]
MKSTPKQTLSSSFKRFFWRGIAFLTFALVLLPGSDLKASHIVGGDITYKCLGNNKYEIILNVYRDCYYGDPLAWFDNPAYIGIYRKSNNSLFQQVNMIFSGINDTLNNFIMDTCLFVPPVVCVHATQYKKIVTIPYDAAGYEILYIRCCRNFPIQNIVSPTTTGSTHCVTLSGPSMLQCNSTPSFGGAAPIFICVNQPLAYDHSAVDPNGDSLVYRLFTPFAGGTFANPQPTPPPIMPPLQLVDWLEVPGQDFYSETNMLGATPPDAPLAINPSTGLLTAFPTLPGFFVVGVAVDEYRNGVLLSTVRRDFQYVVGDCGEVISTIFAPDSQCDDLSVEFENLSTFADEFIWYFDWGGDLSLTSTQINPTFTFPDTGTYIVALIAEPTSQCVDTSFHQIYLQYNSLSADFELTVFDCVDTTVLELTDLSNDPVSPIISWVWELQYGVITQTSNEQNPLFQIPRGVSGTITLTVRSQNGCEQTLSKPFETGTDEFPLSLIPDAHTLCLGDSALLNPQANNIGNYPYYWEPDNLFADPTSPTQTVSPAVNTVYTVFITAVDSLCFAQADIPVTVHPLPQLAFDFTVDCNGRTVNFDNNSVGSDGYFWNFGDPSTTTDTSSQTNPIYVYPQTGSYIVTLTTGLDAFCKDTIEQEVLLLNNILEADFSYELGDCDVDSVVVFFTDGSQNDLNNTVSWSWDFGGLGTSNLQNPSFAFFLSDTIEVMYTITTADNCQDSITRKIWVQLPEDQNLAGSIVICPGDSAPLNPGGNPDLVYLWSPPDGLSDPTSPNPIATPSQSTLYTVIISVQDFNTCFITREVDVTVPPELNLATSGDVDTCDPQTTLSATTDAPATITWVNVPGGPVTGNEVTVPVTGVAIYTVIAEDAFGCSEQAQITVQGGPVDFELNADTILVCTDEPFDVTITNLDPNDALIYQWAPNPAIVSGGNTCCPVIANVPGQTVLYVTIRNQFGCEAQDSVFLAIVDEDIQLDFDYEIVDCDGLIVQFTNLSQNGYDFVWTFGDPNNPSAVSYEDNPVFTYSDISTYNVTLNILYDVACVLPVTKPVELLEPILDADFRYLYNDCGEDFVTIEFHDLSFNFLNNTTNWDWTFSSGETSTLQNPTITVTESQDLIATLVITTALNCTDTVSYTIPVELTTITLADTIILCHGDTTFLNPGGNPDYEYNWTPGTGLSDPTADNPLVFATETTTYNVVVTNFTGDTCQVSRAITVIVPTLINLDAEGGMAIACNEPITLNVVANVSPLDFTWFNAAGDPIGTGSSITVFPTNSTNYYVEGLDAFGCSGRDTVAVTVPNPVFVEIQGEAVSCNEPIALSAVTNANPVTYAWLENGLPFAGNVPTIIVDPGVSAVYTVIVEDAFGCKASDDQPVTVPTLIDMEAPADQVNCNIPSLLEATANVDLDYIWTVNGVIVGMDSILPIEPDSTTLYVVTGTDELGCKATDEVLVTVPPFLDVVVEGDSVSCQQAVTLVALSTVGAVTYEWFEGNTSIGNNNDSLVITPGLTIVYTVLVTDAFNCKAFDTALVIVPTEIEMTASPDIISCQSPVNLEVSANVPLDYLWTVDGAPVADTSSITVNPGVTTWYTVVGSNDLGCEAVDSVQVIVPPTIELSVTPDTIACEGPIVLSATGNVLLGFEWWALGIDTIPGAQFTALPDSTGWYYVLGTDDFGCRAIDSVFVTNGIVDIQTAGMIISCPKDSIPLEVLNLDSFDQLTYVWTAGAGGTILGDTTLDSILVNTIPGAVEFSVTATNQFGCSATETVSIVMSDFEPVTTDTIPVCAGIATPINPGGNPNYTYNWEPVIGGIDPTDPNPTVILYEDQTFSVTITDFDGVDTCSAILEVTVLVNPDIELDAQGDTTLCAFIPVLLTATTTVTPVDLSWYDDPNLSDEIGEGSSVQVEPVGNTIYYVVAEDALGCLDTATVEINAFPIDISTIPQYDLCLNEVTTIAVVNNAADQELQYLWSPEDAIQEGGTTPTPVVNPLVSTTYTVVVVNQYGCVDSASTFVNVVDVLTGLFATADPDTIYFGSGVSSQLETVQNDDYEYFWWPDESLDNNTIFNPLAQPDTTTTYYIEVTETISEAGCRGLDSVTVVVLSPPCEPPFIFVPTAFTPDNDGNNDILYVRGNGIDEVYFAVYSRWGQLLFETTDLNVGWDGAFKGEALPPDVFGYYLRAVCFDGQEYFEKGNVTLLR